MSNDLVLGFVKCVVRERQMHLYGYIVRLLAKEPTHFIHSCTDTRGWILPRRRCMKAYVKVEDMRTLRLPGNERMEAN